jgi:hypothetical protein
MVVATTTGTNFDADGFTVTMDGSVTQAVAANGSTTFSKVSPASHTVVLSGVAANCSLLDGNTRTAVVPAAIPVSVSYSLSCS